VSVTVPTCRFSALGMITGSRPRCGFKLLKECQGKLARPTCQLAIMRNVESQKTPMTVTGFDKKLVQSGAANAAAAGLVKITAKKMVKDIEGTLR
jgi:hypothetical protein